jgi:CBS domain-containing protein
MVIMGLNNKGNDTVSQEEEFSRKKQVINSVYQYSDLSVKNIAQQVDMSHNEVQSIIDEIVKEEALAKGEALKSFVEQSFTKLDKIMSKDVISIDVSKTVGDTVALMTERKVGSVVITKQNKPFGIITERDIVRGLAKKEESNLRDTSVSFASYPLITATPIATVEEAAQIMFKNKIRRLAIVNESNVVIGVVTATDLAMYLSPTRKPGLALSILHAISRGRESNN